MSIIAWIVLGAIAGYLAGLLVRADEGLDIIGHIVLGTGINNPEDLGTRSRETDLDR
jgi:hypothetical protein